MRPPSPQGQCRFCGCTATNACRLTNGDECMFLTARADRCSNPDCVKAFEDERDREIREDRERCKLVRRVREQMKKARGRRWRRAA
jgi:hypothetical protein